MPEKLNHLSLIEELNKTKIEFEGINILSLSQIYLFELHLGRLKPNTMLNLIKILSLDSFFKALWVVFKSQKRLKNSKYLFVNDVYNHSMISNMKTIQEQFDEKYCEVIVDGRLYNKGNTFLWSYFNLWIFLKTLPKFLTLLCRSMSKIRQIAKQFNVFSVLLMLNVLESFFVLNCAKHLLNKHRSIKIVVLNSDAHKVSRCMVLLSQKVKVKSFVLQHGTTVLEYGYLPVLSDVIFTWGNLSNQWFKQRGVEQDKLKTTGTPKMDDILFVNDFTSKEVKNVLIVVNPIGNDNVIEYLNLLYNANIHENYTTTIKLHPSSLDNKKEVMEVFGKTTAKIVKDINIHQLIKSSDVVITTTSTVGNETVAMFRPLIQVGLKNILEILDYDRLDCSHNVNSSEEIKTLLRNAKILKSKMVNYDNFILNYFHALDGKAATRIIDILRANK